MARKVSVVAAAVIGIIVGLLFGSTTLAALLAIVFGAMAAIVKGVR